MKSPKEKLADVNIIKDCGSHGKTQVFVLSPAMLKQMGINVGNLPKTSDKKRGRPKESKVKELQTSNQASIEVKKTLHDKLTQKNTYIREQETTSSKTVITNYGTLAAGPSASNKLSQALSQDAIFLKPSSPFAPSKKYVDSNSHTASSANLVLRNPTSLGGNMKDLQLSTNPVIPTITATNVTDQCTNPRLNSNQIEINFEECQQNLDTMQEYNIINSSEEFVDVTLPDDIQFADTGSSKISIFTESDKKIVENMSLLDIQFSDDLEDASLESDGAENCDESFDYIIEDVNSDEIEKVDLLNVDLDLLHKEADIDSADLVHQKTPSSSIQIINCLPDDSININQEIAQTGALPLETISPVSIIKKYLCSEINNSPNSSNIYKNVDILLKSIADTEVSQQNNNYNESTVDFIISNDKFSSVNDATSIEDSLVNTVDDTTVPNTCEKFCDTNLEKLTERSPETVSHNAILKSPLQQVKIKVYNSPKSVIRHSSFPDQSTQSNILIPNTEPSLFYEENLSLDESDKKKSAETLIKENPDNLLLTTIKPVVSPKPQHVSLISEYLKQFYLKSNGDTKIIETGITKSLNLESDAKEQTEKPFRDEVMHGVEKPGGMEVLASRKIYSSFGNSITDISINSKMSNKSCTSGSSLKTKDNFQEHQFSEDDNLIYNNVEDPKTSYCNSKSSVTASKEENALTFLSAEKGSELSNYKSCRKSMFNENKSNNIRTYTRKKLTDTQLIDLPNTSNADTSLLENAVEINQAIFDNAFCELKSLGEQSSSDCISGKEYFDCGFEANIGENVFACRNITNDSDMALSKEKGNDNTAKVLSMIDNNLASSNTELKSHVDAQHGNTEILPSSFSDNLSAVIPKKRFSRHECLIQDSQNMTISKYKPIESKIRNTISTFDNIEKLTNNINYSAAKTAGALFEDSFENNKIVDVNQIDSDHSETFNNNFKETPNDKIISQLPNNELVDFNNVEPTLNNKVNADNEICVSDVVILADVVHDTVMADSKQNIIVPCAIQATKEILIQNDSSCLAHNDQPQSDGDVQSNSPDHKKIVYRQPKKCFIERVKTDTKISERHSIFPITISDTSLQNKEDQISQINSTGDDIVYPCNSEINAIDSSIELVPLSVANGLEIISMDSEKNSSFRNKSEECNEHSNQTTSSCTTNAVREVRRKRKEIPSKVQSFLKRKSKVLKIEDAFIKDKNIHADNCQVLETLHPKNVTNELEQSLDQVDPPISGADNNQECLVKGTDEQGVSLHSTDDTSTEFLTVSTNSSLQVHSTLDDSLIQNTTLNSSYSISPDNIEILVEDTQIYNSSLEKYDHLMKVVENEAKNTAGGEYSLSHALVEDNSCVTVGSIENDDITEDKEDICKDEDEAHLSNFEETSVTVPDIQSEPLPIKSVNPSTKTLIEMNNFITSPESCDLIIKDCSNTKIDDNVEKMENAQDSGEDCPLAAFVTRNKTSAPKRRGRSVKSSKPIIVTPKRKEKDYTGKDAVVCAVCSLKVKKDNWDNHNLRTHKYLAWIVGDVPLDLDNESVLTLALTNAKKLIPLVCDKCGESRASVVGYISHMAICQKTDEEIEALKKVCPICNRLFLPSSLKVHMANHTKTKIIKDISPPVAEVPSESESNTAPDSGQRSKRKAAQSAFQMFKKMKTEVFRKDVSEFYKKPWCGRAMGVLITSWKKQLATGGAAACPRCKHTESSYKSINTHFVSLCPKLPSKLFDCLACKFQCETKAQIIKHVQEIHSSLLEVKIEDEFSSGSVYGDDKSEVETESSSSESEFEDTDKGEEIDTGASLNLTRTLTSDRRKMSKEPEKSYIPNFAFTKACHENEKRVYEQWYKEFIKVNYSNKCLFPNMKCFAYQALDVSELSEYLPDHKESCSIASCVSEKSSTSEWRKYKYLESDVTEGVQMFWCGGSVWALGWVPGGRPERFLCVSADRSMNSVYREDSAYRHSSIIQIWNCGKLKNKEHCCRKPASLSMAIAHKHGVVWDLAWCPSGCADDTVKSREELAEGESVPGRPVRMGLLAAACSDGKTYIYAVAHPASLPPSETNTYKTEAAAILQLYQDDSVTLGRMEYHATKLCWTHEKDHKIIAVGYSSGVVALFNVGGYSSLLQSKKGNSTVFLPYYTFQPHQSRITSVTILPRSAECEQLVLGVTSLSGCGVWSGSLRLYWRSGPYSGLSASFQWPQIVVFTEEVRERTGAAVIIPLRVASGFMDVVTLNTGGQSRGMLAPSTGALLSLGLKGQFSVSRIGCPFITKDRKVARSKGPKIVWFPEVIALNKESIKEDRDTELPEESKSKKKPIVVERFPNSYDNIQKEYGIVFRNKPKNAPQNQYVPNSWPLWESLSMSAASGSDPHNFVAIGMRAGFCRVTYTPDPKFLPHSNKNYGNSNSEY